jgi:hypothetical protein
LSIISRFATVVFTAGVSIVKSYLGDDINLSASKKFVLGGVGSLHVIGNTYPLRYQYIRRVCHHGRLAHRQIHVARLVQWPEYLSYLYVLLACPLP